MRKSLFACIVLFSLAAIPSRDAIAIEQEKAMAFVGQDMRLQGKHVLSYQISTGEHALVFDDGFSMSIGANQYSSSSAVVWLNSQTTEFKGRVRIIYQATVYLRDKIAIEKGAAAQTTQMTEKVIEQGKSMVVTLDVTGEVFVTADKRETSDVRQLEFYKQAQAAIEKIPTRPKFVVQPEALVPPLPGETPVAPQVEKPTAAQAEKPAAATERKKTAAGKKEKRPKVVAAKEPNQPRFEYPVNIAPVGNVLPQIESTQLKDGTHAATVTGRIYLWQKKDEQGRLLEMQADNAVVFYSGGVSLGQQQTGDKEILAKGPIHAIYLTGNIVLAEGQRTIHADEMYYDFRLHRAVATNAQMTSFDTARGVPIIVRAAKMRQLAENKFRAENVTLTTSEFYKPQISATVSAIDINDTTVVDQETGKVTDHSYDALMKDVRLKYGDTTFLYLPKMRSDREESDLPLKSISIGNDNIWGTSLETRWYFARLLGLQEPEGTRSTLAADYFSKRGPGAGLELKYEREKYFGNMVAYIVDDHGEDRLGRTRTDLVPPEELRGRFSWQHRQYLQDNWQLTTEVSYLSDENFLESYYRHEFNADKEQETLLHLKRIQDNWGLSILGKVRINDWQSQLEELPTIEYHLTGQSLWDDTLTFYSDNQLSRLRQQFGTNVAPTQPQDYFGFASTRNEMDLPLRVGNSKVVPYVAGTAAWEDQLGFNTGINGQPVEPTDKPLLGEAGVRASTQFSKTYSGVQSKLWDLDGLRHIIEPRMQGVVFDESDPGIEQRNVIDLGLDQRLQTKRGPLERQRTVNWMELHTDFIFVDKSAPDTAGADWFVWNKPFVPTFNRLTGTTFGTQRNSILADYIWRTTDTTAVMSDVDWDIESANLEQFDIGFSHARWSNLSYYIGTRYLRRLTTADQTSSNMFIFALTYVIDPRYTLAFSQAYDFANSRNVQSSMTLIRRYGRMCYSLTYSADESLKMNSIVFGIWPQGLQEFSLGQRRYVQLAQPSQY